jgi:hypothetical protein
MKTQYLGDSRDSFKWDYQDHLASHLGYSELRVVPMLTPNDSSNHGQTPPARYPARQEILTLCELLRESRDMDDIRKLPEMTGASYRVEIHRPAELFADHSRGNYFRSTGQPVDKVVFLDPDNGFEPKNRTEKHVGYSDVEAILDEITDDSVVSVFQYFRRRRFDRDFGDIRPRIISGYAAAIYGRYVMFVRTSRSIDVSRSFDNPRPPELPELPRNHPHP